MAKSEEPGWTNLAIGEPVFLRDELWGPCAETPKFLCSTRYPSMGGHPTLLESLREEHRGKHVVVTCGAKQGLLAAFYAFKKRGMSTVQHTAPYWPSYPTLAQLSGMAFSDMPYMIEKPVWCLTSPNNPDGSMHAAFERPDVWDAAYAHPVYGQSPDDGHPDAKVSVWSAAKLYALSGTRVGWCVTDDEDLADDMAYYVEITTSGVSTLAQREVAWARDTIEHYYPSPYREARLTLLRNGELFRRHLGDLCLSVNGVPESGKGMFAWFAVDEHERFEKALKRAKVRVVTGDACGARQPGWYRMSMGLDNDTTEKALSSIRKHFDDL